MYTCLLKRFLIRETIYSFPRFRFVETKHTIIIIIIIQPT